MVLWCSGFMIGFFFKEYSATKTQNYIPK